MKIVRLTSAEKEEIIALFESGVSVAKIAAAYGRTKVTIYNVVRHLNIIKEPTVNFSIRVHPLELEAFDAVLLKYGITNRSNGLRKMIRKVGGFFEERDDVMAEWVALRRDIEGIATNLNQIATACNTGKVDMSGDLPGQYEVMSREYRKLKRHLNTAFKSVKHQKLPETLLEDLFNG